MNARDYGRVEELLHPDVRIIDNADKELSGAQSCIALLKGAAELAPDFRLEVHDVAVRGEDILISGMSLTENEEMSASTQWRARTRDGLLSEWQTYSHRLTPSIILMIERLKK